LYGNDIDDNTSPIEAGLGWITKTKKGDFISRDAFARQREEGVSRKLVGFVLPEERRVPRHDYPIEDEQGREIGKVTSGTMSPSLDYPIGMGYVQKAFAEPGTAIFVVAGKKRLEATVARPPFYKG
ncbi:MAG: glycine cleavage system aminomethyltransferase GcvT, partial [Phaeodactylibacter sp.]|nr:glycine cleavage system aminomethyltransferase GcvT [Phaeodactylibacter sp.]